MKMKIFKSFRVAKPPLSAIPINVLCEFQLSTFHIFLHDHSKMHSPYYLSLDISNTPLKVNGVKYYSGSVLMCKKAARRGLKITGFPNEPMPCQIK